MALLFLDFFIIYIDHEICQHEESTIDIHNDSLVFK